VSTFDLEPEASDAFEPFARAGLARLGVRATPEELAVMETVDRIYRPHFEALMEADLSGVEAEVDFDPARAP
jgi:hypothetical protein